MSGGVRSGASWLLVFWGGRADVVFGAVVGEVGGIWHVRLYVHAHGEWGNRF